MKTTIPKTGHFFLEKTESKCHTRAEVQLVVCCDHQLFNTLYTGHIRFALLERMLLTAKSDGINHCTSTIEYTPQLSVTHVHVVFST